MMVKYWRKIACLILAVMVVLLLIGCAPVTGTSGTSESTLEQTGDAAPDFQIENLQGNTVSLRSLRGRPVMLNFWATWCPPCRGEMPLIQQIYEEWTGKPPSVVVLTIDIGESKSTVEEYLRSENLNLPVLLDINRDVAEMYRITGIPTTYFIDAEGTIREIKVGAFWNKEQIEDYLHNIIP